MRRDIDHQDPFAEEETICDFHGHDCDPARNEYDEELVQIRLTRTCEICDEQLHDILIPVESEVLAELQRMKAREDDPNDPVEYVNVDVLTDRSAEIDAYARLYIVYEDGREEFGDDLLHFYA